MNEELIAKARQASSSEEIMKIAEENDIEMCKEEAEMIYKQLHTSGEVSDEELESVAGGGCKGSGGLTIVTSACKCFNGQFEQADLSRSSDMQIMWSVFSGGGNNTKKVCGECKHLVFKSGIGYCGVSG